MIHANSRNQLAVVVEVVDAVTGDPTQPPFVDLRPRVTDEAADDRFITTTSAKDWAHYGLERLGDARHYWILADLSDVIDPFAELTPGRQLRCPSLARFLFKILASDATAE